MPALPPYRVEPIWQQFAALLPEREIYHPLYCRRSRIPHRVAVEKLVQVLVFGCAYEEFADGTCSATTLRDRRDEWIELGAMGTLREFTLRAYDRLVGLELPDVAVDRCPANRHDSPLLIETLEAVAQMLGGLRESTSMHLDRGYDSETTRRRLRERALGAEISRKGEPVPLAATKRWVGQRTNSWH